MLVWIVHFLWLWVSHVNSKKKHLSLRVDYYKTARLFILINWKKTIGFIILNIPSQIKAVGCFFWSANVLMFNEGGKRKGSPFHSKFWKCTKNKDRHPFFILQRNATSELLQLLTQYVTKMCRCALGEKLMHLSIVRCTLRLQERCVMSW